MTRGFFGIGTENGKTLANLGTLWRSAHVLGADFLCTIAGRYRPQASDTMKSWRTLPLWQFSTLDEFFESMPRECLLVGVELDESAVPIQNFVHPERALYLLGAEDSGLSKAARARCHHIIQLPGTHCMNVAAAGTVVMYDRVLKRAG